MFGQTMLIAYDGSPRADAALEQAARLLRTREVEILTAWEPAARLTARTMGRSGMPQTPVGHVDTAEDPAWEAAQEVCRQGVAKAEALGLVGRAHLVEMTTTIADAIVEAANELDADVIVTGTRALTGFKALWTTSTADQILRNAGRPVFIVPPEDDAADPEYF